MDRIDQTRTTEALPSPLNREKEITQFAGHDLSFGKVFGEKVVPFSVEKNVKIANLFARVSPLSALGRAVSTISTIFARAIRGITSSVSSGIDIVKNLATRGDKTVEKREATDCAAAPKQPKEILEEFITERNEEKSSTQEDFLTFYKNESENHPSEEIAEQKGYDYSKFGPFSHQEARDINHGKRAFPEIEGCRTSESDRDKTVKIFHHLLAEIEKNEEFAETVKNDPKTVYLAVHAAIAGMTQGFEVPSTIEINKINRIFREEDSSLAVTAAAGEVVIYPKIEEGKITVTCKLAYPLKDASAQDYNRPLAFVEVSRSYSIPIHAPDQAINQPMQYTLNWL